MSKTLKLVSTLADTCDFFLLIHEMEEKSIHFYSDLSMFMLPLKCGTHNSYISGRFHVESIIYMSVVSTVHNTV